MASAAFADGRAGMHPKSLRFDTIGGIAVAIGSFGVILTSLFYVLSPAGAVEGLATMRIAGSFGVFGNLVMRSAACSWRSTGPCALAAGGWAAILMSLVVFEIIDGLFGFVLS